MEVPRKKIEPTDTNIFGLLRENHKNTMQDYYYKTLFTIGSLPVGNLPVGNFYRESISPIKAANQVFRAYNFIGITERLDGTDHD